MSGTDLRVDHGDGPQRSGVSRSRRRLRPEADRVALSETAKKQDSRAGLRPSARRFAIGVPSPGLGLGRFLQPAAT